MNAFASARRDLASGAASSRPAGESVPKQAQKRIDAAEKNLDDIFKKSAEALLRSVCDSPALLGSFRRQALQDEIVGPPMHEAMQQLRGEASRALQALFDADLEGFRKELKSTKSWCQVKLQTQRIAAQVQLKNQAAKLKSGGPAGVLMEAEKRRVQAQLEAVQSELATLRDEVEGPVLIESEDDGEEAGRSSGANDAAAENDGGKAAAAAAAAAAAMAGKAGADQQPDPQDGEESEDEEASEDGGEEGAEESAEGSTARNKRRRRKKRRQPERDTEAGLRARSERLVSVESELHATRSEVAEAQSSLSDCLTALNLEVEASSSLKQVLDQLVAKARSLAEHSNELEVSGEALTEENDHLQQRLEETETELLELRRRLGDGGDGMGGAPVDELTALRASAERLEAQVAWLTEERRQATDHAEQLEGSQRLWEEERQKMATDYDEVWRRRLTPCPLRLPYSLLCLVSSP